MTQTRNSLSRFIPVLQRKSSATPRTATVLQNPFLGMRDFMKASLLYPVRDTLKTMREKLRDLPQTNYDLGCVFLEEGKPKDALFRFRVALYFQENFPDALYQAANACVRLGKPAEAIAYLLKTLALKPADPDALYILTALDADLVPPSQRPTRMPISMVRAYFDQLAPYYDALEREKQYQGARKVGEVLLPLLGDRTGITVLDLGCGSGIASRPWRARAQRIVGVDATPAMLEAARAVRVGNDVPLFDALEEADLLALPATGEGFPCAEADLVVMINVAQFLGDLNGLWDTLTARLASGVLFAFTYEAAQTSAPFVLNGASGRFGHSGAVLEEALKQRGWRVLHHAPLALYPSSTAQLMVVTR